MSNEIAINEMTPTMYISELMQASSEGKVDLVEAWSHFHVPVLYNALMLLSYEERLMYAKEIIKMAQGGNGFFLPVNHQELQEEHVDWNEAPDMDDVTNEDERWSMSRMIAVVSLLNNMARDYHMGHDRIVMALDSDAKDPESELYQMCIHAFGPEHPVTGEQIARMLNACAADANEHVYAIFKDQFDALATIVYNSVETSDENGDPIMVYSHGDQFYITLRGDHMSTSHPSGDVYVAIQDAAGITPEAIEGTNDEEE